MKKTYIVLNESPEDVKESDEFTHSVMTETSLSYEEAEQKTLSLNMSGVFYICEVKVLAVLKGVEKVEYEINKIPE